MPSRERGLITAIIDSGTTGDYLALVKPHWFFEPEARRAWAVAAAHFESYRESISRELLREQVPSFAFERWSADPDALLQMVEDHWIQNRLLVIQEDAAELSSGPEGDVRGAIAKAQYELTRLIASMSRDRDTDVAETAMSVVDRYRYRRDHKDEIGLPFPWLPMQQSLHGMRPGNYLLFYGRHKSMKSWMMLYVCKFWRQYYRRRVLMITREMTKEEIQDRDVALWAEVDMDRFEAGELTEAEEIELEGAAEASAEIGHFFVETVDGHGAAAVAEIAALVEKYQLETGDILAVDGLYFFSSNDWQHFRAFSQGLKALVTGKDRQLCLVATNQGNRSFSTDVSADAGKEMSMGDAPIQDCDMAVKLVLDPDEQHVYMGLATQRRGRSREWVVHARPCTDFSLKYSDSPDNPDDQDEDVIDAPVVSARKQIENKIRKSQRKKR